MINYVSGKRRIVDGESVRKLDQDTARLGMIELRNISDGHRVVVIKANVEDFEEIPQLEWDAQKEAQRAREVEAHRKREADAAEVARLRASRTLRGRFLRLIGKGPKP